jgi:hypothetical protein
MRSRLLVAVVSSVVTMLVVGGIAWAVQSPVDGSGVIHACYNPNTGVVKMQVQPTCPRTGATTPVSWNVQGPPGDTGSDGPTGPQGPAGQDASIGALYSAAVFRFTTSGCDLGQFRIEAITISGTELNWGGGGLDPCRSPDANGHITGVRTLRRDDLPVSGTVVDMPGDSETGFLPPRYYEVNGLATAMRCDVGALFLTLTDTSTNGITVTCDLIGNAHEGGAAAALARIQSMVDAGVESSPLVFRQI